MHGSRWRREETGPVGTAARRWRLPPTLHRAFKPPRPPLRLDREPGRRLGSTAGAELRLVAPQARASAALLIHDNDAKFTRAFEEVFRDERVEIVCTPVRAPRANAIAERFVGTLRRECLDWLLIAHRRHLERVLRIFVEHYNGHRAHRALNLRAPDPDRSALRLATHAQCRRQFAGAIGSAA
jgi:transposase InsO family protein